MPRRLAIAVATLGCVLGATAQDEIPERQMNVRQGPMPSGHSFSGVYRSPQIGDIDIVQTGDSVVGRYEYDRGSCHVVARLEGSANGNASRTPMAS